MPPPRLSTPCSSPCSSTSRLTRADQTKKHTKLDLPSLASPSRIPHTRIASPPTAGAAGVTGSGATTTTTATPSTHISSPATIPTITSAEKAVTRIATSTTGGAGDVAGSRTVATTTTTTNSPTRIPSPTTVPATASAEETATRLSGIRVEHSWTAEHRIREPEMRVRVVFVPPVADNPGDVVLPTGTLPFLEFLLARLTLVAGGSLWRGGIGFLWREDCF